MDEFEVRSGSMQPADFAEKQYVWPEHRCDKRATPAYDFACITYFAIGLFDQLMRASNAPYRQQSQHADGYEQFDTAIVVE